MAAAAIPAVAQAGEPLDLVIWRTLGRTAVAVEATLAASPGLAALGVQLPEGTPVLIPAAAQAPAPAPLVQLWD